MTRSWAEMMSGIAERLVATTGDDVPTWNARVQESGATTEPELRAWLAERGITGYAQMLLVMERFGYLAFLTASADELVEAQYADRPDLRPVYDAVVAAALALGEVHVQARKGYVSLVGPRRTFAVLQASTKSRVDLGLRLDDREPGGRLLPARSVGNRDCAVRIALTSVDDVDDEVRDLLAEAYRANV
ncbi:DUF5655 domain-containing protein [Blastococcus sp. LR1]|uniref:DUF5655 domain-containing protein n=1 Tax=Blastococcus sp. LR1 TaxID=2877000 RepID=UPI001CCCDE2D|nr:DUF5655 domain-containing protein [Blastococcus sp. LR1]MCA0144027.1 DUF5655 domain-containing protein [Blastococcus sp. LR1]